MTDQSLASHHQNLTVIATRG